MKLTEADRPLPRPVSDPPPWRFELAVYRALTTLARPAAGVILGMRERQGKEDPARRAERLGTASLARPDGPLVWVHAASVGEANAVLPLIEALRQRRPDCPVLMTTGTVTSAEFIAKRRPAGLMHQYVPLDSTAFVQRFLAHWRPALGIFTEQEIWPNLVMEASRRRIPMALVNARMSDRSFERWTRRAGVARALFSRFRVVAAQNATLAGRFEQLGAGSSFATGNLKIDAPPLPVNEVLWRQMTAALGDRPRIVAASTHNGEEDVVAAAHTGLVGVVPGLCTIIAPRHPERGAGLADALAARGFAVRRRSRGEMIEADTDIYIADTIGELGTLYALTPLAFIGGSLIPHGGQNPIEAVRHGAGVLTGPHWHNFTDAYRTLLDAHGAIEVRNAETLAASVGRLLADPHALTVLKANAQRALVQLSGALERTLACLLPLIPEPREDAGRAL